MTEPFDLARLEAYFADLLNKLERIATVMERFDNVMNPTLGLAEAELASQVATTDFTMPPGVRLQPIAPSPALPDPGGQAPQQVG